LWPNTPDILHEFLQTGGRPAFTIRLLLAATLAASYGIYGPAFELQESTAREPGSEEYRDSEKYQTRHWDLTHPGSLRELVARVNQARRENPALQRDESLHFHYVSSENLICYSKRSPNGENLVLVVVNLDPHHAHHGWTDLNLDVLGLESHQTFQVDDLLSGARYRWEGARNYVEIDPHLTPGHLFVVRRHVRTEEDFSYYM
jgi:starch synthase (maltosyl-transferring)